MQKPIVEAARRGNLDEVRRLVEGHGVDPNAADRRHVGLTPLHVAAANGHVEMAQYLIEEARCDVDRVDDYGRTPLHWACKGHRLGMTPTHLACPNGNINIVEYLVEERQVNVDSKDEDGYTSLDTAVIFGAGFGLNKDVFLFLLPRTPSIATETLSALWNDSHPYCLRGEMPIVIEMMVLEKYAFGRGLASDFLRLPIHTIISHFPLPSPKPFQDFLDLFPASVLSLLDEKGRLPIHIALFSSACRIVSSIFEREPRSALTRDPITGLYPHETAAGFLSRDDDGWLDVVYKMFRSNPQQLLQSRGLVGCGESTLLASPNEDAHVSLDGPKPKRTKIEHKC